MDLLPAAVPPHKELTADPGADVRLELCRLAVGADDRLGVCDLEVRRGGTSFTVDTLRALDANDTGTELTLIVGGDMALSLPTWREPAEVLRLARLGVAERGATSREDIERSLTEHAPGRFTIFSMPRIDISSTDVRARIAAGRRATHLVPGPVAAAIAEGGLYR